MPGALEKGPAGVNGADDGMKASLGVMGIDGPAGVCGATPGVKGAWLACVGGSPAGVPGAKFSGLPGVIGGGPDGVIGGGQAGVMGGGPAGVRGAPVSRMPPPGVIGNPLAPAGDGGGAFGVRNPPRTPGVPGATPGVPGANRRYPGVPGPGVPGAPKIPGVIGAADTLPSPEGVIGRYPFCPNNLPCSGWYSENSLRLSSVTAGSRIFGALTITPAPSSSLYHWAYRAMTSGPSFR